MLKIKDSLEKINKKRNKFEFFFFEKGWKGNFKSL